MQTFLIVWLGQLTSLIGSRLTSFALGVWIYQTTGSATDYALILLSTTLPQVLFSPLAGVIADRWNRRWVMLFSDWGAGMSTLLIALLLFLNQLHLWHIYIATAISAIGGTLQKPAYLAAIPQLVPSQRLVKANGLIMMADSLGEIIAPMAAGFLLIAIKLQGIILIDVVTFLLAVVTLLMVKFPPIIKDEISQLNLKSSFHEFKEGWQYLANRRGLLALILYFGITNLFFGIVVALFVPLVLSFASESMLGILFSMGGVTMLLGSLWVSTRLYPSSYIKVIFRADFIVSLCVFLIGFRSIISLVALCYCGFCFVIPFTGSCLQTLFQKKVAPQIQGRVFAIKQSLSAIAFPLAYISAGLLADHLFEPFMKSNHFLALLIGQLIGFGKGRGIALMYVVIGIIMLVSVFVGYRYPRIRLLEQEIPDVQLHSSQ